MKSMFPEIKSRKSIRLKQYDYSLGGAYYVTICVQDYVCRFGKIKGSKVILSDVGKMIEKWWHELSNKFNNIENDVFIIMPNHIHGIILLYDSDKSNVEADLRVCPGNNDLGEHIGSPLQDNKNLSVSANSNIGADLRVCPGNNDLGEHIGSPLQGKNHSLSKIIQWFKTMTTNEYIRNVKENKWEKFEKRLWQRNYYEHIIRNQKTYNKIGEYIYNNPAKWAKDELFVPDF